MSVMGALPGLADAEPAFPDDAVEVGLVIGAWGLKGGIRVKPFSNDPKALFSSRRWFVRPPESTAPAARAFPPLLRITMSKDHGDGVVATAQEIADRTAAEGMKGARIFIARTSFPTAGDGEYYWIDLIGLDVVNREGEALGQVIDLLDTGAHSVLRLRRPDAADGTPSDQAERLIPFVGAYIDDVNLAARRITVDWGLDY
jgi:16S rRNA processing protein RimM